MQSRMTVKPVMLSLSSYSFFDGIVHCTVGGTSGPLARYDARRPDILFQN